MTGSAASRKQPTSEQLSLANIFLLHWGPSIAGDAATLDVRWSTRWLTPGQVFQPEVFAPPAIAWVGRRDSRGAMSALQEAGGNACWLSSQCPRCIADGFARAISPAGHSASRRFGARRDEFDEIAEGPPLLPRFTPAGNFALRRCVEQDPAKGRLWFRSRSDDRVETEAATVAVQRQNEHQHEKEKYVQGHSPRAL
jgi:hypothetical protein